MNWQPIETAPKNGTPIWALGRIYGKPFQFECEWNGVEWYHGFGDGWRELNPSHWMPLPAAPGAPAVDESFEDRISDWAHGDALDAARYRWLRDNATRSGVNIDIGAGVEISATLDAAVDDAMRLTAAKGPQ